MRRRPTRLLSSPSAKSPSTPLPGTPRFSPPWWNRSSLRWGKLTPLCGAWNCRTVFDAGGRSAFAVSATKWTRWRQFCPLSFCSSLLISANNFWGTVGRGGKGWFSYPVSFSLLSRHGAEVSLSTAAIFDRFHLGAHRQGGKLVEVVVVVLSLTRHRAQPEWGSNHPTALLRNDFPPNSCSIPLDQLRYAQCQRTLVESCWFTASLQ